MELLCKSDFWPVVHQSITSWVDLGNRRDAIFSNDADRERFPLTLGEVCGQTGRRIFQQGLAFFGIRKEELALLKKGDARTLTIANAIRLNTVVAKAWIAQELNLDT